MTVGLAIFKVPELFSIGAPRPLMEGVVTCLTAICILAFVGLRYPVRMLPLLLFESIWKPIWLAAMALPAIMDNAVDPAMSELIFNCSMVVIILAVIPWRYVWRHCVTAKGDRWRCRNTSKPHLGLSGAAPRPFRGTARVTSGTLFACTSPPPTSRRWNVSVPK